MLLPIGWQRLSSVPGAIAKRCSRAGCTYLVVRNGEIHDFTPLGSGDARDFVIGPYLSSAAVSVPESEAPVREITTATGWKIVITAALEAPGAAELRVRLINPDGNTVVKFQTGEMNEVLRYSRAGPLFGGNSEVALIGVSAPHPYTGAWWAFLLPSAGNPKLIGRGYGTIQALSGQTQAPGFQVIRQRPVNDDANRALTIREFWAWCPASKKLVLTQH